MEGEGGGGGVGGVGGGRGASLLVEVVIDIRNRGSCEFGSLLSVG